MPKLADLAARFTAKEQAAVRAWLAIPPASGKTTLLLQLAAHCDFHTPRTFAQAVLAASGIELTAAQTEAARAFLFLPPSQRNRLVEQLMEEERNA